MNTPNNPTEPFYPLSWASKLHIAPVCAKCKMVVVPIRDTLCESCKQRGETIVATLPEIKANAEAQAGETTIPVAEPPGVIVTPPDVAKEIHSPVEQPKGNTWTIM